MFRLTRFLVVMVAVLAVGLTGFPTVQKRIYEPGSVRLSPAFALSANAQSSGKKRRSLFSVLFGNRKARKKAVKRPSRAVRSKSRRAKRSARSRKKNRSRSRSAAVAAKAKVAKTDDAKRVLVIGGFMADNMARGLRAAMADVPNIVVLDRSNGRSGFVRTDVVNWPEALPSVIEKAKADYVVAMLGANDRQSMRVDGKRWKRRTEIWDAEYQKRAKSLGDALKASGLPHAWVGLPPVRYRSLNTDYLVFNEWYSKSVDPLRGKFVDIWDGFSNAEGAYSRSGPDVNGQIKLLRLKDGMNFSRAGRQRLAFYLENEIKRTLGAASGTAVAFGTNDLDSGRAAEAAYDPAKTGKTVVLRLNDPAIDGDVTLAGDAPLAGSAIPVANAASTPSVPSPTLTSTTGSTTPTATASQTTNLQTIASTGRTSGVAGRVDDFSWPPADAPLPTASTGTVAQRN
ncbi:MAG: SGNH family hydrolase [Pseudomonadota bacterium]